MENKSGDEHVMKRHWPRYRNNVKAHRPEWRGFTLSVLWEIDMKWTISFSIRFQDRSHYSRPKVDLIKPTSSYFCSESRHVQNYPKLLFVVIRRWQWNCVYFKNETKQIRVNDKSLSHSRSHAWLVPVYAPINGEG